MYNHVARFGGGGDCPICPFFEYQSPMHKKKHESRVFIIRYCINSQNFWGGGGEAGGFGQLGGKLPPCTPQ